MSNTDISVGILELVQDSKTRETSCTALQRNCFSVRVVKPWNSLPEFVVSSINAQTFESRLDRVWLNQPVLFHHKEELSGHRRLNILHPELTDNDDDDDE